jgi:hypothetical protein
MIILRAKSKDFMGAISIEQIYEDEELEKAWEYEEELRAENWKVDWIYFPNIKKDKYIEKLLEWSLIYGKK